jgi:hypothetical protein
MLLKNILGEMHNSIILGDSLKRKIGKPRTQFSIPLGDAMNSEKVWYEMHQYLIGCLKSKESL